MPPQCAFYGQNGNYDRFSLKQLTTFFQKAYVIFKGPIQLCISILNIAVFFIIEIWKKWTIFVN